MKINIIGDGSFGGFLRRELPKYGFEIGADAETVILAVPLSAYAEMGEKYQGYHIVNVCSVQSESTEILFRNAGGKITSIHPLFGARTPKDKRNSILTYQYAKVQSNPTPEKQFLDLFRKFSAVITRYERKYFTPESHDILMARTHCAAVMAAKQMKVFVDRAADVPDELIPNSFRLLREFVKTMEDCPPGTISSIMANPYI